MKKVSIFFSTVLLFLFFSNINAEGQEYLKLQTKFKNYFNEMNLEVKNAESPAEKRDIISSSLNRMNNVLDKAEQIAAKTAEDKAFLAQMKSEINDKLAELNGENGYEKVADADLNNFANYVQQNMEQADKYVTISLTTLLLVVIVILLVA